MKRKALSLILAMLIILASFPLTVFAADGDKVVTKVELTATKNLTEKVDGCYSWYYDTKYFYYYLSNTMPDITFTYSDGSVVNATWDECYDYSDSYSFDCDQSLENELQPGKHTTDVTFWFDDYNYQVTGTLEFTIEKHPVKSITIAPQKALIEKADGSLYYTSVYNEETSGYDWVKYFRYDLKSTNPIVTVEYNDGTPTFRGTLEDLEDSTDYWFSFDGNDQYNNPFKVGKNTAVASFRGIETTFEFEIKANPVKSLTVKPTKALVEYVSGWWDEYEIYDEETDDYYWAEYFYYDLDKTESVITVEYNDGTPTFTGTRSELYYATGYPLSLYSDGYGNDFKVGKNTAKASFMGIETTFEFEMKPSPVKSLTITPKKTLIENTNGYWSYSDDDEKFFYYYLDMDYDVTVEYNDGTPTFKGSREDLYDETDCELEIISSQYANPFKVGKNTVTAKFMGFETEFDIEIKKTPVKSVTVKPQKALIENHNGYWDWDEFYDEETDDYVEVEYFNYEIDETNPIITVEFNDGTPTFTGTEDELHDKTGYWISYVNEQYKNPFKVGKNTAKAKFMGVETTFEVEIKASPIKSLTVTPNKSLIENANGYWTSYDGDKFFYYYTDILDYDVIVEYNDGTPTFKGSREDLYDETDCELEITSGQYGNPFKVGKNTVTAKFMGFETEFNIEVKKTPVKSITIKPQRELIENLDGYWEEHYVWDDEAGEEFYEDYFEYDLSETNCLVTVEFNDGTPTFTGPANKLNKATGYSLEFSGNDQYTNPFKLGKNTAKVSFMGFETTFEFEIIKTPVKNIKITIKEPLIENFSGSWESDYDENDYFYYDIFDCEHEITVEYKDGSKFTGTKYELQESTDWEYYLEFVTNQYKNPLKVGKNTVKATFMGYEVTFDVEVIENPIKSISVKPLKSLQEFEDGFWEDIYDEETWDTIGQWWRYSFSYEDLEVTINYKDKTKPSVTYTADKLWDIFEAELRVELAQSSSKPLIVGKNQGKATFMGVSCNFDFTIIGNQVKSISAKPTKDLIAYWDGYYTGEDNNRNFYYDISMTQPEITVTYLNGTKKTFSYAYLNNKYGVGLVVDQDKELATGTHTAKLSFHGCECDYKFNIVKNNIKNIVVTPTRDLVENEDGYISQTEKGVEYFRYNLELLRPNLTINYTDGKSVTYDYFTAKRVLQDRLYLNDNQYEKGQLKLGVNTATAEFNNVECEFKFNIVKSKNAITGLTVTPNEALLENSDGYYDYYYDEETDEEISYWYYNKGEITYNVVIKYADGTTKTFKNVGSNENLDGIVFDVEFNQSYNNPFKAGKNTATATYGNIKSNFQVEVKTGKYKSVAVSGDTELAFTLTKVDGTKDVLKAENIYIGSGGKNSVGGTIYTDKGIILDFTASYELASDKITHKNIQFELREVGKNNIKSNILASNRWFDMALQVAYSDISYMFGAYATGYDKALTGKELTGFSGSITGVNVDHALSISSRNGYYASYENCGIDDKGRYAYLTIDEAKELAKEYFDVSKIDFTSSPNYNSSTKKIKVRFIDSFYYNNIEKEKLVYQNNQFVYTYGIFSLTSYEETPVTLVLAKDGTVSSATFTKGACGATKTINVENAKDGVKVTYSAAENATGYEIYRSTNGGAFVKVATTADTSYVDSTAVSGKTYTYKVRGINSGSAGSFTGTKTVSYLAMPKTTATLGKTGFTVKWTKVDGASTYRVFRAEYVNGKWSGWSKLSDQKASVTSLADKTVKAGGIYKYTVRALASGGVASAFEGTPTLVYLLTPTVKIANAKTGVAVSWSKVAGATGYTVYRQEFANGKWGSWVNRGTAKADKSSWTDTKVVSGTTYRYTVRAINGANKSLFVESNAVLYLAEPTVAIANAKAGVTVKWTQSTGAKGYTVYRSEYNASTKKWSSWKNMGTAAATKTSWTDKSVKAGVYYKYTVRAVNGKMLSTFTASASLIRLAEPTVAIANAKTGITVKWSKVAGATGYTVYRQEFANGKWGSWVNRGTAKADKSSWTDTKVVSGTIYRYAVRAVNGKQLSSYTATGSLMFLGEPTVKIANAANGINVSWSTVTGAKGYTVYRSEYNAKTKKWSGWSNRGTAAATITSWTDKKVVSGTYYKYTVRAVSDSYKSTFTSSGQLLYLAQPVVTVTNATNSADVKWTKSAGAKGYVVYRQEMTDGAWGKWTALVTTNANVTSYSDKTVEAGKEYRYTARATNGNYKSNFAASNSVKH